MCNSYCILTSYAKYANSRRKLAPIDKTKSIYSNTYSRNALGFRRFSYLTKEFKNTDIMHICIHYNYIIFTRIFDVSLKFNFYALWDICIYTIDVTFFLNFISRTMTNRCKWKYMTIVLNCYISHPILLFLKTIYDAICSTKRIHRYVTIRCDIVTNNDQKYIGNIKLVLSFWYYIWSRSADCWNSKTCSWSMYYKINTKIYFTQVNP